MSSQFVGLLVLYLAILLACAPFLGRYIRRAVEDGNYALTAWGRPLERLIYRLGAVRAGAEMGWKQYTIAVIAFNLLGVVTVYALQRLQGLLPLNPQGFGAVTPDSAFNTAISFVSNTNWQGYAGESTMAYLTQMLALTVQNFLSAATGIAVVIALIRGFARQTAATIGNFWVDMTRVTLYVLAPIATVIALALVSQGVIQNFDAYKEVSLVAPVEYSQPKVDAAGQPVLDAQGTPVTEDLKTDRQTLAMGPVASQEAIKMLGTNGGGFFNANSAHPFENPNALANLIEMLAIFLIPAALCFTFGEMVGDRRQGVAVLGAMALIFVAMACVAAVSEQTANPALSGLPLDHASSLLQAGGNMEGKETRFGIAASALFATITTAASCGGVNAMHDSFTAIGGLVPMLLMQLGEVVFGGVGSGLYGMLVYAVLAVFIAGLMIGRTPEYLGKKIETYEMKMVAVAILVTPLLVLLGTSVAVMTEAGRAGVFNPGTHGFSEILYALSSAANNNGSAFAGLSANTPFYNTLLAAAMWFGRFWIIIPVLALAGSLAAKKRIPPSGGTMPTHGPLFVVLLVGTVLLVGALTYVPALALGPVAEHLQGAMPAAAR
ncbi:potassium-transporting ATPase subunit KdpA [Cupriavidus taiwanensis]|uniref:potassium-transporting ATPase subunit KdpA n=1 Tax=Cupriavidus taiwanensis TaxID=164546 RepID=UPI000E17E5B1|nr:potassium-transporting ATPase subunit KdpA [Cupriavidus taiwanensis]SOY56013.1 P-type ATPase, high-affinity potassium transport system, A chain [Cupriavidus taiwanensis]